MQWFECDYAEGAHPRVLKALIDSNALSTPGYGEDAFCARAKALLRSQMQCEDCEIFFTMGGTQTNLLAIAQLLRPHQSVICAQEGHIHTHETGAIEATGHQLLIAKDVDGKLTPDSIRAVLAAQMPIHATQPKLVYLSQPTEWGTVYTRSELSALHALCREAGLLLYLDGARLGCALAAQPDVSLPFLARVCDAFYIGGTKNGALFGEALVFTDPALCRGFDYLRKQRGGLLAKGRLLGAQFEALFTDGLYTQLGAHANAMARRLQDGILAAGYPLLAPLATNQVFPVLPKALVEFLETRYVFRRWGVPEDPEQVPIRLVTAFTTTPEAVDALIADLAYVG